MYVHLPTRHIFEIVEKSETREFPGVAPNVFFSGSRSDDTNKCQCMGLFVCWEVLRPSLRFFCLFFGKFYSGRVLGPKGTLAVIYKVRFSFRTGDLCRIFAPFCQYICHVKGSNLGIDFWHHLKSKSSV